MSNTQPTPSLFERIIEPKNTPEERYTRGAIALGQVVRMALSPGAILDKNNYIDIDEGDERGNGATTRLTTPKGLLQVSHGANGAEYLVADRRTNPGATLTIPSNPTEAVTDNDVAVMEQAVNVAGGILDSYALDHAALIRSVEVEAIVQDLRK